MDRHGISHRIHIRRSIIRTLLVVAVALVAGVLSQCRLVDDTITGVDLSTSSEAIHGRSHCVRACKETYKKAKKAEEKRHSKALRACHSDKACRKAEKRRHEATEDQLQDAKRECKRNCYNEGGGHGGR